jgi:hypothetical protein
MRTLRSSGGSFVGFDPAKMSVWIDQRNTKMNHDRGVTIYYNAPAAGDLSKWSYEE